MSWWSALDELALVLVWMFVPGLLIGWIVGLRGLWLAAGAPGISVAIAGVWPIILAEAGIRWNTLSAAACSLVTALAAAAVMWFLPDRRRGRPGGFARLARGREFSAPDDARHVRTVAATGTPPRRAGRGQVADADAWDRTDTWRDPGLWWALAGVLVAGGALALAMHNGMSQPQFPAQTWDAVFHLNGLRYITDTGDASSLDLGVVANTQGGATFYPAAWHAIGALAVRGSVVVAANMLSIVTVAVVTPLGMATFGRALVPQWPWLAFTTPVVAAAYIAYPTRLAAWGTVWPMGLSFALVPLAVALTIRVLAAWLRWMVPGAQGAGSVDGLAAGGHVLEGGGSGARAAAGRAGPLRRAASATLSVAGNDRGARGLVGAAAATLATLIGAALTQPAGVVTYAVFATPAVVAAWVWALRHSPRRVRLRATAWLVAWAVAWAGICVVLSLRVTAYPRGWMGVWYEAIIRALGDGNPDLIGRPDPTFTWVLVGLTLAGVITIICIRRARWVLGSLAITVALYALVIDTSFGLEGLMQVWYSDPLRLGAMVAIIAALVGGVGLAGVAKATHWAIVWVAARFRLHLRGFTVGVATAAMVVGFAVGTHGMRFDERTETIAHDYSEPMYTGQGNILLSMGEYAMLNRLRDELPADAKIIGDPFSGAALAWAIADVPVVFSHVNGKWAADAQAAANNFRYIAIKPQACEALNRMGVHYLYVDDQTYFEYNSNQTPFEQIDRMPPYGKFTLVDQGGSAKVYHIDQCDPGNIPE